MTKKDQYTIDGIDLVKELFEKFPDDETFTVRGVTMLIDIFKTSYIVKAETLEGLNNDR